MKFWETYQKLCLDSGKRPNPVGKELGISTGSIAQWKNGSVPSGETLVKIADYFHVSVDYLLGRTENTSNIIHTGNITGDNNITGNSGDVTIGAKMSGAEETAREINTILSVLTPRQRTELMMMIYQFADEHTVQKSA